MSAQALYLRVGDEPLFALYHPPAEPARETAVLICPPYGWDELCSYRSRREWATQLASLGYAALRFDLPGTGDSAGSPEDPGRLAAWTAAATGAAAWLRAESGARRVVAIGIGLGGLVAWQAAAEGAAIDDLVLWGVTARGRSLVRQLRAFARVEAASNIAADRPEAVLNEGDAAPGGFALAPGAVDDLHALDLTALPLPDAARRRVLLLGRDGTAVDETLRASLEEAGAAVEEAPGEGYGEMMEDPAYAKEPVSVFESVAAWLEQAGAASTVPAGASVEAASAIELTVNGARIRESVFDVQTQAGVLPGVLAEPLDAPRAELVAAILNGGAVRRIGHGRMSVDIARRWAARGVPTLRLDFSGLGEAEGEAGRYADFAAFYVPEFVAQARAAVDALEAHGLPRRAVLAGLCSGGYWSFWAAVEDERVAAAFMLNPRVLFWEDTLEATRQARRIWRELLDPRVLRKLLKGKIRLRIRQLGQLLGGALLAARARLSRKPGVDRVDDAFDRLRDAGKRGVFFFSHGEPLLEELEAGGQVARLDRWPNLELVRVPGWDHTLRGRSMQEFVHEEIDRAIERELGP